MSISRRRVKAIFGEELHEYRRNGNIIYATAILPVVFLIQPIVEVFTLPDSASLALHREHALLYLLAIPVLVPAALAAYAVVGERLQGTLEPLLATPIRREELLLGKAAAAFVPSVIVAYLVFAVYIAIVELFAHAVVASALIQGPELLVQLIFTPLLAAWSIWVGIAISARASDPRTAAQLAVLASLPTVAITTLTAFNVIPANLEIAVIFGVALAVLSRLGWRFASAIFDRERLITGARGPRRAGRRGQPERPAQSSTAGPGARSGAATHPPQTTMTATMRLTREGAGIELRRGRFDLHVDDEPAGHIERHETIEVPLEPGRHTARLTVGRYSSRTYSFDAGDGQAVSLRCHGAMLWPRYVASLIKPDLAISLKQQSH